MSKFLSICLIAFAATFLGASNQTATAQPGPLPSDPARGLSYAGLQTDAEGNCVGGFEVPVKNRKSQRPICTHGPDPAPPGVDIRQTVPAVTPRARRPLSSTAVCDGDGMSGKRVQVIYAHASDVPDNYAAYLSSFQQWVAGVDSIFNASAAETGGERHVRFVTDSSCNPILLDVTLSTTGDDTFGNMISDLQALGYGRSDRDYIVFMNAHMYCGIASIESDDQPGPGNLNNLAPHYARIDAGCWSDVIAAHELMHNFGGVQFSAPHSDGTWHCVDGYDDMCDHSGHLIDYSVCPNPIGDSRFDCNHDDYYSTNPPSGSYLATHWNAANSQFLILPPTLIVSSMVTGKMKGKTFMPTDTFKPGDTVLVRTTVVDQYNSPVSGAMVTLTVIRPDGTTQCTVSAKTDSTGKAQGSCQIPRKASRGTWNAHASKWTKSGYTANANASVTQDAFSVQ